MKYFLARPSFAMMVALAFMSSSRLSAQNSFTMYVANYNDYGPSTYARYFTVEKFDAKGNASVFATNRSFSNPILDTPNGIALDSAGNVYVSCFNDGTWIEKFNPSGTTASRFGNVALTWPQGMVCDNSGNLYVANLYAGIEKYSPGGIGTNFATAVGATSFTGLAIDAAGDLYAANGATGVVERCGANGILSTYVSPGNSPFGLTFDNSGNLYVALSGSGQVVKYDTNLNETVYASLGSSAELQGLAFDAASNLYVAEYHANRIVKIDPLGNVTVFATNGLNGPVFLAIQLASPTTVDSTNHFSYGANFGWMDWHDPAANGANNGAVIGEYVCSGYIYSANVGWINLGGGTATNGIYYQNLSSNDFGVNLDSLGNLRGCAWGANIGWVNFENTGAPVVNLQTGILSGNVWSANCGWISLNNAFAYVQTDVIAPGLDSTGDGIPNAWALQYFGTTNINPNTLATNGMTLLQNYLGGTNPNDPDDVFAITFIGRGTVTTGDTTLEWASKRSRSYAVQYEETLDTNSEWADVADYGLGADSATFNTGQTNGSEFYRIRAFRPLIP